MQGRCDIGFQGILVIIIHRRISMARTLLEPRKYVRGRGSSSYIILNLQLWDFSKGLNNEFDTAMKPGRVAQSVGHLTRKSGVLGSIPSLATYFRFSVCFFKKGSCQLLAKVCAGSTG